MANSGNPLSQIKHIVVLMMENRSFDNMLGWLYDPENNKAPFNQQPPSNFEGLYGKKLSNPGPEGDPIPVGEESHLAYPLPDPGETYENVYCQLYNEAKVPALDQVPPDPPQPPEMKGFVTNYSVQPSITDPKIIMNCFRPVSVPVLSSLAYYFAVCDHWFASIPSETLCNRSFLYSGTSSGYVNNEGGNGVFFVNRETPTIFSLLEEVGITWKIYCASWRTTSLALLTQARVMWRYLAEFRLRHLDEFVRDAQNPMVCRVVPSSSQFTWIPPGEPKMICTLNPGTFLSSWPVLRTSRREKRFSTTFIKPSAIALTGTALC